MYSGLIIGHILIIVGCVLITLSLVDMYMKLAALGQGKEPHRSPKWIDGILLLSGLLIAAGGTCYIIHWIIDYRLIPACQG
ncbi:MAG: hypothetical protein KAS38_06990 [Anaerolineales bacterium]|nr:hypothetical protein [Anaerolineales bacterium]